MFGEALCITFSTQDIALVHRRSSGLLVTLLSSVPLPEDRAWLVDPGTTGYEECGMSNMQPAGVILQQLWAMQVLTHYR